MLNFASGFLRIFKDFIGKNTVDFNNKIYDKKVLLMLEALSSHNMLTKCSNIDNFTYCCMEKRRVCIIHVFIFTACILICKYNFW